MTQQVDVLVIGGGIVGLSAAVAMRQRGLTVALLEAHALLNQEAGQDLRVYAINQASQTLFEQLGVWQKIAATDCSSYQHMYVWDAQNGAHIDFDARLVCRGKLGDIMKESTLKAALLQQANALGVLLIDHTSVTELESLANGMRVKSNNKIWQCQLLIVADGAHSKTRDLLNISLTTWSYHQEAIVASVRTEKEHQKTAYQVFHPNGPLAFLPLTHPNECSIVWSASPTHAKQLMQLSDEAFQKALAAQFEHKLGQVMAVSVRRQFPLYMRHATSYSGSRWLLMGDAAHTIHPLAGLGLNVGLADLTAWLSIFDEQGAIGSKKMMAAYQRARKHAVWQTIFLMEGLKYLFSNPLPPMSFLRAVGLTACNYLPLLKRAFIEHAAG